MKALLVQARDALQAAETQLRAIETDFGIYRDVRNCIAALTAQIDASEAKGLFVDMIASHEELAEELRDAPEPEPAAWLWPSGRITADKPVAYNDHDAAVVTKVRPLYLHPQASRQPLNGRQIYDIMIMGVEDPEPFEDVVVDPDWPVALCYVRDIEAAHGIMAPAIQAQRVPTDDTEGGAA